MAVNTMLLFFLQSQVLREELPVFSNTTVRVVIATGLRALMLLRHCQISPDSQHVNFEKLPSKTLSSIVIKSFM